MALRTQPKRPVSHRHTQVKRVKKKAAPKHASKSVAAPGSRSRVVKLPEPAKIEPPRREEAPVPVPVRERSSYDGDSAIKLYLREIGLVALLTPEQEIELAAIGSAEARRGTFGRCQSAAGKRRTRLAG